MVNWKMVLFKELVFTELYYEFNKWLPFILKTPVRRNQQNKAYINYVFFCKARELTDGGNEV